jgi:hypothetical protein
LDPISGSTKQFIELHNPDAQRTIDLHGYRLRGSWDGPEVVFNAGQLLPPKVLPRALPGKGALGIEEAQDQKPAH